VSAFRSSCGYETGLEGRLYAIVQLQAKCKTMMRFRYLRLAIVFGLVAPAGFAQDAASPHPETSAEGWTSLFSGDLSNAVYPEGVWTVADGVLTASEDQAIWTDRDYDDFVLDLEFKMGPGANSGVLLYTTDIEDWIPNSVEIQIADDSAEQWATSPPTWHCGAVFGRLAPSQSTAHPPGEWNRYTITARGPIITVVLNGAQVAELDMRKWTSAEKNPDGSEIPSWLSKPLSELPTHGRIGLQGKHAGAPIWFRNVRIRELG